MRPFLAFSDNEPVLIGRGRELELLRQGFERTLGGLGTTVLIGGEAGIGKTHLVTRFRDHASSEQAMLLQGQSYDLGASPPYGPWRQIFADRRIARSAPGLPALFGEHVLADPVQNQTALFSEVVHVTDMLASEQPLVLIFEDLHWADVASIDLLRAVGRHTAGQPIMIVATYRNDELTRDNPLYRRIPVLLRETQAQRVDLHPLDAAATFELVNVQLTLSEEDSHRLVEYLLSRTQGNPFFMHELLNTLLEDGSLTATESGLALARDITASAIQPVPELIRQVTDSRLLRLGTDARRPLELASVIGHEVALDLWEALSDTTHDQFITAVRGSIESQVLRESADGQVLSFRHTLVRDALYTSILLPERMSLHARCGEFLATNRPSDPDLVANHFVLAQDSRAVEWLTRSGEHALAAYAPDNAIQRLSQAAELATAFAIEPKARMFHARGLAHAMVGQFSMAQRDYTLALERARADADRQTEWRVQVDLGLLWSERNYDRTYDFYNHALDLAREIDDELTIAHSLNRVGNWYLNNDRPHEAIQRHEEALAMFRHNGDMHGVAQTTRMLGMSFLVGGDLPRSNLHFREAADLFTTLDDRLGLCSALTSLIYTGGTYTFHTEVIAPLEPGELEEFSAHALQLAVETRWRAGEAHVYCALGSHHGVRGNYDRALEFASRGLEIAKQIGHREWMALAHQILGRLYLDLFAITEAGQHLEQSLTLAETAGAPIHARLARSYLAHVHLAGGRVDSALETLEHTLSSDGLARTVIERKCWAAQASLALSTGDPNLALSISDRLLEATSNRPATRTIPLYGRLRGEALTQLGRYDEADQQLHDAHESASISGFRPVRWRLAAALGRLYAAWDHPQESANWFSQARALTDELARSIPDERLRETYLSQARDRIPVPRPLTTLQSAKHAFSGLTARQREVSALVARGHSNVEIADLLSISPRTAEGHVTAILTTLNFSSRAQIAAWAVGRGIVEL